MKQTMKIASLFENELDQYLEKVYVVPSHFIEFFLETNKSPKITKFDYENVRFQLSWNKAFIKDSEEKELKAVNDDLSRCKVLEIDVVN